MASKRQDSPNVAKRKDLIMALFEEICIADFVEPGKFRTTKITKSDDGVTALYDMRENLATIRIKILVDQEEIIDPEENRFDFQISVGYKVAAYELWYPNPYINTCTASGGVAELLSKLEESVGLAERFGDKESLKASLGLRT